MKVIAAGYDWYYCNEQKVYHPHNETAYVLYVFNTPAKIQMHGKTHLVDYGNVLLMPYGEAHEINYIADFFKLDWIEFQMDNTDLQLLKALAIPFGQIIAIRHPNMLPGVVLACCFINDLDDGIHKQTLHQLLTSVFYTIHALSEESGSSTSFRKKHPEIIELRRKLYEEPQLDWNISMMCEFTNYSQSNLQRLYKQFYDVTCKEDIIISRILLAKNLLCSTNLSVSEIAFHCGFHSYEHFFRTFRKQAGCTPKEFRNIRY